MKKRWLILFITVFMITGLTTTVYANQGIVLEDSVQVDLIDWVTQTGGMSLAERAQINMFVEEQTVADYDGAKAALVEGILNWETDIDVSEYQIPVEDAWALYSEVCYENPQLFYIETGCSYSYFEYLISIRPNYNSNFTEEDVSIYEAKVEEILEYIPNGMNEEDTAVALHDYLVSHCAYDTTYSNYDAYSALVEGSCVCQGYALAYSDLLNRCNIENEYVVSDSMNHAWNLVNVDDEWYHVDATWDDPLMGGADFLGRVGHNNFLRSDDGITDTGHYSWVASNDCDATKYDNYYWTGLQSAIVFSDAATSYYMQDGVLCQRKDTSIVEISDSADDIWHVWESSGYWGGSYNSLVLNQNNLYYNSSDVVYVYNLITGEESLHYTYTGGEGYVYGLAESSVGDVLLLNIKTSPNEKTVDVVSVETINNKILLNQTNATLTSKGETLQLTAIEGSSNVICEDVVWKSSDTSVATVDNNGIVTAVGNGTAVITATTTDGTGRKATCYITVEERYKDGLNLYADGNLYYFKDNKIDTSYNGVADYENETWYVANGKVDTSKSGVLCRGDWYYFKNGKVQRVTTVASNKSGWWYIENGEVNFEYDGVGTNGSGTWYIENGKVDFNKTGVLERAGKWYYFNGGKVQRVTTVANNKSGWWYIENGEVNFEYDGVGTNESGTWYIENGKVDFNKTGLYMRAGERYYFRGGKVDATMDGVISVNGTWYLFEQGKINNTTTVASNKSGWWYIENGEVNFEYDGVGTNGSGTWYIENGKVDFNKTGVLERAGKWYYFNGGKVQKVTTVANNKSGWWYIENGEVNFEYDGVGTNGSGTWYIENGKVDFNKTGVLERAGKWYYFNGGKVQRVTTVASNKSGCWYIENGEVNFEYTGIYKDSTGNIYNIKNGHATLVQ